MQLKGSRKKIFFGGPATKALSPPPSPSNLVATFFRVFFELQKSFLSGPAFTLSPLLVAGPIKKNFSGGFP